MAIRTRGNSLQIDVQLTVRGASARHREAFHGTMEEARERERQIKDALRRGDDPSVSETAPAPKGLTLRRALEDCYDRYWKHGRNRQLMETYIQKAEEFFGADTLLSEIGTEEIDAYISHLGRGGEELAPQTVRQRLVPLSKAFTHFVGSKAAPGLSRPQFRYPARTDNMRTRVLTDDERSQIAGLFAGSFDHATSRRRPYGVPDGTAWADLMIFLMDTGVRPSEARALRSKDLRDGRIYVWKTKTSRPRTIPLTDRAEEAFLRQCHRMEEGTEEPFGWASKDRISWAWRWLRSAMGLTKDPGFIPYVLRHDCATRLYEKTRDLLLVKEWMGHTTMDMTLRYAKLNPHHMDNARDLLQAA